MTNTSWYFLIDRGNKTAIEYTQLPEVRGNTTGINTATDETLADLSFTGEDIGYMKTADALAFGISQAELNKVLPLAEEVAKELIREKRDIILNESDRAVTIDRWDTYDAATKLHITEYRKALRDMPATTVDVFNPVWPVIPSELDYLNAFV